MNLKLPIGVCVQGGASCSDEAAFFCVGVSWLGIYLYRGAALKNRKASLRSISSSLGKLTTKWLKKARSWGFKAESVLDLNPSIVIY